MNNNLFDNPKIGTDSIVELERAVERRKGSRSFLEVMITISLVAIGVLLMLIAIPLPREIMDIKITLFFAMELLAFFPLTLIFGILLTLSGRNKKTNSDLIIRLLIYIGSYVLLGNVILVFFLRYFG